MLWGAVTNVPPLLALPDELLLLEELLPDELPEELPEPELLDELLVELELLELDELDELPLEPEPPLKTQSAFAQVKPLQQSVAATQAWPSDLQTVDFCSAAGWLQAAIARIVARIDSGRAGRSAFISLVPTIWRSRLANGRCARRGNSAKA